VGLSYLAGAAVPVWAYIFFEPGEGLRVSAISTVVVLFAVGALKTIITSRSWWRSGLESMLGGVAAAGATYAAGRMFAARSLTRARYASTSMSSPSAFTA